MESFDELEMNTEDVGEVSSMDSFEELNTSTDEAGEQGEIADIKETGAKKDENSVEKQVALELREELINNPEFRELFKSRTQDLKVINTLGFSDKGGQVSVGYDSSQKNAHGKDKHLLDQVSEIVGYKVRNEGDQPIKCDSQKWVKDEATGKFVPQPYELVINAGEEAIINKRDLVLITMQPEFSFNFANGMVVSKLKVENVTSGMNINDLAEMHHIRLNEKTLNVHDDTFKINISHQEERNGETVWVVNDEYVDKFGYLNNEPDAKVRKEKVKKEKKPRVKVKIDARDVKAAFLMKAIQAGVASQIDKPANLTK